MSVSGNIPSITMPEMSLQARRGNGKTEGVTAD
jgi:hypothetical protein